jgi:polysaccharide biosynthesis protein PslH
VTSRRLRILYVAPYEPSDLAVRARLLIGAIAQRHDVHVVTLRRPSIAPASLIGSVQRAVPSTRLDKLLALRHVVEPSYPLQTMAAASRTMRKTIAAAMQGGQYDLVHVEHLRALPYLPAQRDLPVLFDAVDCVSELFRLAARERKPPSRWLYRAEAGRLRRYETRALTTVDRVVVTSRRDAAALRECCPQARIAVVTNPVDCERFTPGGDARSRIVVMTGKMSFHANSSAARWLCERVWPLVRAEHPDACLFIAGTQPPRSIRRLACEDIHVGDYVPDLAATIRQAAVAVAPLRYAVGVQNKVLEALACATPVVATPAAIGDLGLQNGRDAIVAATAEDFARGVSFLLSHPTVARQMGQAGLQYAATHHSIAATADLLESEYYDMLGHIPRRRLEVRYVAAMR